MERTGGEVPGFAPLLKERCPARRNPGSQEAGPYTRRLALHHAVPQWWSPSWCPSQEDREARGERAPG